MALFHRSMASIDRSSRSVAVVSMDRWRSASTIICPRVVARALGDGDGDGARGRRARGDRSRRARVVRLGRGRGRGRSLASAASGSGSASEEGGDGFSSARDEEDATTTLRSVLTRKPSVAALKALGTLGRGAGSDEEEEEGTRARAGTTREGEDEDGACSLERTAMVLNAAGWVRDAMGCDANGLEYRVVSRGRGVGEDGRTDAYFARARGLFFAQDTEAAGQMSVDGL